MPDPKTVKEAQDKLRAARSNFEQAERSFLRARFEDGFRSGPDGTFASSATTETARAPVPPVLAVTQGGSVGAMRAPEVSGARVATMEPVQAATTTIEPSAQAVVARPQAPAAGPPPASLMSRIPRAVQWGPLASVDRMGAAVSPVLGPTSDAIEWAYFGDGGDSGRMGQK